MSSRTINQATIALIVIGALLASNLLGTTHFVSVDGNGFSPSALEINAGDTVVWTSNDELFPHTTTSDLTILDPDYWNGSLFDFEDTFQKTFNNAGTFTYHDDADIGTGTITVNPVAMPTITLTAPRVEEDEFLMDVSGLTVGKVIIVEVSTNVINWTPISTNLVTSETMTLTNAIVSGPNLFRVQQTP